MLDETTAEEALHIARWYLMTQMDPKLRYYVKGRFMSNSDLVQDVMLHLLRFKPKEEWNLTTLVCNAARWAVGRRVVRNSFCDRDKAWFFDQLDFDVPVEFDLATDVDFADALRKAISVLSDRSNKVLFARMSEVNLRDIGKILGISGERVRQLENKCAERFRSPDCARSLEQFVDPLAIDAEIERRNPPRKQPEFLPTNRHSNASQSQAVAEMERDRPTMQEIRNDFFPSSVPVGHELVIC